MSFAIAFTASAAASAAAKGASGMRTAQAQLDASAHNLANAQTPDRVSRLAENGVAQRVSLYSFAANLRVVQTQDAMLGTLLDVRA